MIRQDFDSDEEYYFYHWLVEAEANGIISGWDYHNDTYELIGRASVTETIHKKTREVDVFLFNPVTYTPDFVVFGMDIDFIMKIQGKRPQKFRPYKAFQGWVYMIDVKGKYEPVHSKTDIFSIKQKLMWDRHNLYVNKIVPIKFFKKTWVPEADAYWKKVGKGKPRKRIKQFSGCRLISEVIGSMENERRNGKAAQSPVCVG